MGDMNAKLGTDNTGRDAVMGKEGIREMNLVSTSQHTQENMDLI